MNEGSRGGLPSNTLGWGPRVSAVNWTPVCSELILFFFSFFKVLASVNRLSSCVVSLIDGIVGVRTPACHACAFYPSLNE